MPTHPTRRHAPFAAAILAIAACGGSTPPAGEVRTEPLMTAALAGASVIVLPVTMVIVESGLALPAGVANGAALVVWADSLVAEAVTMRAPEVRWVLPAELRRVARRSPGVAADPDQMGQAILRQPSLNTVPDPLRSHLRTLMALAGGGRHAFVPAAVLLESDLSGGLRARIIAVLADGRSGAILWRTESRSDGPDPSTALRRALATIFPLLQP